MLTFEIKSPRMIQWLTTNKVLHNLLGPAYTTWYDNGQKEYEAYWWVNGKKPR